MTELGHVVRMLRSATERYRASGGGGGGGTSSGGAGGKGKGPKRKDDSSEDEGEDGEGGAAPPASGSAPSGPPMTSAELLAVLREVVRMTSEYASILTSQLEDAQERGDATSASNVHLASRLRVRQEEISDLLQLMHALRETRAGECDKERGAAGLSSTQLRTVTAELHRVWRDAASLRRLAALHAAEFEAARRQLGDWEKGAPLPAPAGAPAPNGGDSAARSVPATRPELRGPSGALVAASDAALAVHGLIASAAGLPTDGSTNTFSGRVSLPSEAKAGRAASRGFQPPASLSDVGSAVDRILLAAAGAAGSGHGAAAGCTGTGPSQAAALLLASAASENAALLSTLLRLKGGGVVPRELPELVPAKRRAPQQQPPHAPEHQQHQQQLTASQEGPGSPGVVVSPRTARRGSVDGPGHNRNGGSDFVDAGFPSQRAASSASASSAAAALAQQPQQQHQPSSGAGRGLNPNFLGGAREAPDAAPAPSAAAAVTSFDAAFGIGGVAPSSAAAQSTTGSTASSAAAALLKAKLSGANSGGLPAGDGASATAGNPFGGLGGPGSAGNPFGGGSLGSSATAAATAAAAPFRAQPTDSGVKPGPGLGGAAAAGNPFGGGQFGSASKPAAPPAAGGRVGNPFG